VTDRLTGQETAHCSGDTWRSPENDQHRRAEHIMDENSPVATPVGTIPVHLFYAQDERRAASRTLNYGSRWTREGWTGDADHVVELYWLSATHELVAFYVAYDWSRVDPSELTLSASETIGEDYGAGLEVSHLLRVLDEASAEIYVEVLAHLGSDLECHKVMFGWQWLQHHPDGLDHIRHRLTGPADSAHTAGP